MPHAEGRHGLASLTTKDFEVGLQLVCNLWQSWLGHAGTQATQQLFHTVGVAQPTSLLVADCGLRRSRQLRGKPWTTEVATLPFDRLGFWV